MTAEAIRDAEAYGRQMRQLLPRGAAWGIPEGGVLAGLLDAFGDEFARIDARAADLLEEADPRTALELLPDWERVAGLPDSCTGQPDNVGERQVALHQKLTGVGGQNAASFIEIAARVGFKITIEEHRPARMGMRMGERLNGPDWAFVWTVHVQPFDGSISEETFFSYFKMGSRMGDRMRGFGSFDIECVIRRAAPAHTIVLFAYEVEPSAAFWIDLTQ